MEDVERGCVEKIHLVTFVSLVPIHVSFLINASPAPRSHTCVRSVMRSMVLAACRSLGPIWPAGLCRAAASASRGGRGARGAGGRGRGGGVGGRQAGGRGRKESPSGSLAGETKRGGRPSPRSCWDQRAEADSARRGVSTSAPRRVGEGDFGMPNGHDKNKLDAESRDAPQRVAKLMAWRGLCSRREAETLIERCVVMVDGELAKQGDKAFSDVVIELIDLNGKNWLRSKITIVLNKPVGVVSNLPDRPEDVEASALITERNAVDELSRAKFTEASELSKSENKKPQLNVCGRLDKDSRGLLVLTQDGVLAKAIIGGNEIPKTYLVTVDRPVTDQTLKRLNGSVSLEGVKLLPMVVERLVDPRDKDNSNVLQFTLREGKNRQIRRVCDAAGLRVVDLLRTQVGSVELSDLPEGTWRVMTDFERDSLRQAGGGRPGGGHNRPKRRRDR